MLMLLLLLLLLLLLHPGIFTFDLVLGMERFGAVGISITKPPEHLKPSRYKFLRKS